MTESSRGYIHGTDSDEQERLALLNRLSNAPFGEFMGNIGGLRVLEVGSGLGILASELAVQNPSAFIVGLEFSLDQLRAADTLGTAGVRLCRGDGHNLPFPTAGFDLVYCRYLLEHVQNPLKVVGEVRRVLKPGGRAVAQENNILINQFYPECESFDRIWSAFATLQASLGGDALIGKKLFDLFKAAGFRDIELSIQPEVHWYGSPGFEGWIRNLIGNIRSAEKALVIGGFSTASEIGSAIAELDGLMSNEHAAAYFYWNRIVGFA